MEVAVGHADDLVHFAEALFERRTSVRKEEIRGKRRQKKPAYLTPPLYVLEFAWLIWTDTADDEFLFLLVFWIEGVGDPRKGSLLGRESDAASIYVRIGSRLGCEGFPSWFLSRPRRSRITTIHGRDIIIVGPIIMIIELMRATRRSDRTDKRWRLECGRRGHVLCLVGDYRARCRCATAGYTRPGRWACVFGS
jgi:hypothetical protein